MRSASKKKAIAKSKAAIPAKHETSSEVAIPPLSNAVSVEVAVAETDHAIAPLPIASDVEAAVAEMHEFFGSDASTS